MKKRILVALLLLIGIGVLAYPVISNYIYETNGSYVISDYEDTLSQEDDTTLVEEWAKAVEYNQNLLGNPVRDPFLDGSGVMMPDNYTEILNVNGTMGYIEIPAISVKLPIYHGTSESVLQKGIGHLEGTTLPIGGEGTHSVLTGHTGLINAKIFTDLDQLEEGDVFYITILNETLAYEIDDISVIDPEDTNKIKRVDGEDYVTLLTCTPYGVNSHRLLVRGTRTEYIPEQREQMDETAGWLSIIDEKIITAAAITATVMLVLFIIALKKKREREREEFFKKLGVK